MQPQADVMRDDMLMKAATGAAWTSTPAAHDCRYSIGERYEALE